MVTEQAEYGDLKLPRPSLVIYLKVPAETSAKLSRDRSRQDQHEADLDYQKKVAEVYQEMADVRKDWVVVDCVREGKLRSPEEIHQDVLSLVLPLLSG